MKTKILTESRAMWQLAWPVLIGQLATVGMGVADVAMTGHASANDLAAVALGASLWAMVLVTVMGVMMAINAIVAHEVGANAHHKIPHIVRQSLWMGLGVGLVGCVLLNLSTVVFDHIYLEDSVRDKAAQFVHVISIGLPPFACYRALYGYTASLNQTKPVMVIALFGLAFNVCINWLLIYGHWGLPKLGATGCAVATGVGMWLMLGAMVLWIKKAPAYQSTYPFTHREPAHWPEIRKMLRMGLPIGVTYFAEVSAFCVIGLLVARFGVVTVSAHQIALNFSSLVFMVPLSFGIASVTRVGQAMGENDTQRARFSSWVGVGLSLGFAVISALMITLFRQEIAAAYTSDVAVQQVTVKLLLLAAIFQLSDGAQVAASSAIRGYKITRTPMLIHLTAFWGVCIPLGCILGLAPEWFPLRPAEPMAASGFWISLVVGLTIAAVSLVVYLHRVSTRYLKKNTALA
ncbi:MATE family efflux transporter [Undibacterium sp. RTI2.1]|uniref:MATE family efflux transporter n=3 Tax=Undibacterium TaxID=401469 RepID=UPI002AB53BD0|nr:MULTISPECIES: MATE family efflux transporter [unclassified Undibacterium]MDY7540110.1 MATE family efflux transporter [Undibacterium sp. 5I1]MEB0031699.1 MATE family efflux transporter [Undibacterium sp. RTI2.1]MEB0118049.1 MATE family efflux transporter [Undibacterium sp. RTI2.2]MEB0259212.1 MATE family efflux transporter [Undibacterium sp. 5I1]